MRLRIFPKTHLSDILIYAFLKNLRIWNLDENLTVIKYARKLINYQRDVICDNFHILLRTY
ncbi:hypothetical protein DQM68_15950 [Leptospira mayottensis]|uniref:Uncharacterized protein n=1 Tax=Leptospira mayottensis TaxID=1137606 RepID=A0ABM6YCT5_9LEPT|nr:hypothetical protein DQM68_15950 [Leptospira mayottensis]AXR65857.1 hypothetical protein DQM28_18285 [Leptospira mayottensis]AZQ01604.1 hypothetical protein LEP1GSC190_05775 [Leptospira mayottensis 200901116]TGM95299.1 hypothetical protein EHR03_16630 [Leptospira mayottensis]